MGDESMKCNRAENQRGSISPLVIGAVLIGAMLLGVIADSARVFLVHRELVRLADSTALAAASALDLSSYYSGGSREVMPLDRDRAWQIAQGWVEQSEKLDSRLRFLQITSFMVESGRINVTLSAQVLAGSFYTIGRSHAIMVSASASASSQRG